MSVTLTLTSRTAERAVLQVAVAGGDTVTRLTRTDRNGTAAVRVPAGVLPITTTTTVEDYEYALYAGGAPVTWRAYAGSVLVATTSTTVTTRRQAWLTVPRRPSLGRVLNDGSGKTGAILLRWTDTRDSPSTVHRVIDRADPVVVLRPLQLRTATLELVVYFLAQAQELQAVLAQPEVFMLRESDQSTLDVYFTVVRTTLVHADEPTILYTGTAQPVRRWTLTVELTEVARLPGEVTLDAGWTYDTLAAANTTYVSLLTKYATYADMATRGS